MKKQLQFSVLFILSSLLFCNLNSKAQVQGLTNADYKKACWMTTRMYGGQRSGDGPNWLTMDHTPLPADLTSLTTSKSAVTSQFVKGKDFTKDADGNVSLSGGWVDCGDHVKFGQTMFYAAYTLLKGYAEFPAGYDDIYTGNYSDYQSGVDFSWEGGKGKPNGIPDILDELKYECDFFIKCTPDASTFYSQVGDGGLDHQNWVTSPVMAILPKAQGGQADGSRSNTTNTASLGKNKVDASMSSICSSTLALMSRVYAKFDPAYAATCLTHAKYAYAYAKANPGTVPDQSNGTYYGANKKWQDDFASACAELYWATGTASYKAEALSYSGSLANHNWCYNYNNNDDVAAYNLAKLGDAASKTLLQTFVTTYIGDVSGGIYNGGDKSWGTLRYPANAAFVVALWGALNKSTTVDAFIYNQIDFILGKNSSNFSFVVGFKKAAGGTYACHPHHRNVYLINDIMADQNSMTIPTRNIQQGYLIGGARSVPFTEKATDYKSSEGGIDYNAGLVGALGYILSRIDPIDTNKFGHPTPQLGENQSMCGVSSIVLDSKVATDGKKTFTWKKDGTTVVTASTTAKTYSATAAGVYLCQIDSTGWSTTGTVIVTATLPDFSLGKDTILCSLTSDTLKSVTGTGFTYAWKKNGTTISGATSSSYIAYNAGTYICTISAAVCASKSDTITITSSLPTVVNDTICKAGTASLSVTSPGTYAWYTSATGGTSIGTGPTQNLTISASSVYYVQDATSVAGSAGPNPTTFTGGSNGTPDNQIELRFEAIGNYTITNLYIPYMLYGASEAAKVASFEIVDDATGAVVATQTGVTGAMNSGSYSAQGPYLIKFNVSIAVSGGTAGSPKIFRIRFVSNASPANSGNVYLYNDGSGPNSFPYPNSTNVPLKIIGSRFFNNLTTTRYACFVKIDYLAGSSCSRAPVLAIIDPNVSCGGDTQAPTTPGTITFGTTTETSIIVNWTASTDNIAVTAYELYMNGALQSTVTGTTATVTGLTCNTAYTFKVRAKDAAGNYSAFTADAIKSTSAVSAPTVISPITYTLNATATALTATGTALKWYTVATAGSPLATAPVPSTTASGSTSYYVSQTLNTCESPRATIVVSITTNSIQTITLVSGWNLISFNVQPIDSSVANVFGTLGTSLLTVKTQDAFYDPNQTAIYNSLTKIVRGKAYVVKVNATKTLTVSGNLISTISIPLNAGWNLVGYPKTTNGAIATVLSGIWTPFSFIKNFDGFYQKSGTTNSLTNMIPGSGYFIKVSSSCTLNY